VQESCHLRPGSLEIEAAASLKEYIEGGVDARTVMGDYVQHLLV
jgi:hypothetical protein